MRLTCLQSLGGLLLAVSLNAQTFILPTPNRALLEGAEERYFVGTAGKTWVSGTFGCVRSDGRQFHEGIDIRATKRDKAGEPIDPVYAAASGVICYINEKSSLSNYGRYLVIRHEIEGLEVETLYAHLSAVAGGLRVGSQVRQGQVVATMGRTSNTRQRITLDRAHLHFEIDFVLNDRFAEWHKATQAGQRNDHGNWNGHNLVGIDPRAVLLRQAAEGQRFSLVRFLRDQPELCRVLVRPGGTAKIGRQRGLLTSNPKTAKEGVAAYEVALNFNGVPIEIIPRAKSETGAMTEPWRLLSVNDKEATARSCVHIVVKRGKDWVLGKAGERVASLLAY